MLNNGKGVEKHALLLYHEIEMWQYIINLNSEVAEFEKIIICI